MRALGWWLALGGLGCRHAEVGSISGKHDSPASDSGAVDSDDGGDDSAYVPCTEIEVDAIGPDEPVVGDQWVLWLSCDGARLVGPIVIHIDPVDFCTVEENVATFVTAGTASITVDSGVYEDTIEVTVSE